MNQPFWGKQSLHRPSSTGIRQCCRWRAGRAFPDNISFHFHLIFIENDTISDGLTEIDCQFIKRSQESPSQSCPLPFRTLPCVRRLRACGCRISFAGFGLCTETIVIILQKILEAKLPKSCSSTLRIGRPRQRSSPGTGCRRRSWNMFGFTFHCIILRTLSHGSFDAAIAERGYSRASPLNSFRQLNLIQRLNTRLALSVQLKGNF